MKQYYVTTKLGRGYKVHARGIDDAAWTCAKWLDDGDLIIRIEIF